MNTPKELFPSLAEIEREGIAESREWGRKRLEESQLTPWVEARLHQLRHGQEKQVLAELAGLKKQRGAAGEVLAREQNNFNNHSSRMNYRAIARRGWPIGSGAVESACRQ